MSTSTEVQSTRIARNSILELILTFTLLLGITTIVRFVVGPSPISQVLPGIHTELFIVGVGVALLLAGLIMSRPGKASGGHMNPAISLAMWRFGVFPAAGLAPYIAAQLLGSVLGVLTARVLWGGVVERPPVLYAVLQTAWHSAPLFVAEGIGMGIVVFIVGYCLSVPRFAALVPWIVGILIGLCIVLLGTSTGGSLNPARQFGPAVISGHTTKLWIYLTAPMLGAAIAAQCLQLLQKRRQVLTHRLCGTHADGTSSGGPEHRGLPMMHGNWNGNQVPIQDGSVGSCINGRSFLRAVAMPSTSIITDKWFATPIFKALITKEILMRMTRVLATNFMMALLSVMATGISTVAYGAQETPNVAVEPQYDTTHVYVRTEDFDRFVTSITATFGGTISKQAVITVTPTSSSTISQLVFTPVGTFSVFGFKTPIPFPFGSERTGLLVTDMDAAIRAARASRATVLVIPFNDPIGMDAVIQWPGGVNTQLYWHTAKPSYKVLQTIPENRVYLSADAVDAFLRSYLAFAHAKVVSDDNHAPGIEIGRPKDTYRRIRIESNFGKLTVLVTDGHLPYPYGRELTGYEVANVTETLSKAKAAGATVLVPQYDADHRYAAFVQFPGGYIAKIHSPVRK